MLKKGIKAISLLLLCFIIIFVVSCKKSGSNKEATLHYTRWAGVQEAKDFQALVDTFMEKHPNIKVETEFLPWGAYWEKLRTSLVSGKEADVISLSIVESAPYLAKAAFYKMDKLPGAKKLLNEMYPGTKAAVMYDGSIYGIPVGVGVRAMIYNKAMFDEAGIEYPDNTKPMTWDEFIEMSKKLIKKQGNKFVQYPALFHSLEMYEAIIVQCGGKLMDDYVKPSKILINSGEAIKGLEVLMSLYKNNIMPPFTGEWNSAWGSPDSAVATGKVAIMHVGPWGLGPLDEANIKYGAAPIPKGKKRANRGYINWLAIGKNSKNPEAAWQFISWMCSKEGQLEFTKTGDLPANKAAMEESKKSQKYPKEIMAAYYSELPYVITGPMIPNINFNSMIDNVFSEFLKFEINEKEAVKRFEAEGNKIIEETYGK